MLKIQIAGCFVFVCVFCSAQQSTFIQKNDSTTITKKDADTSKIVKPFIYSRKGFSIKKDSATSTKPILMYNGKEISQEKLDSVAKNWEAVHVEFDYTNGRLEKHIYPSTKQKYDSVIELTKKQRESKLEDKWKIGSVAPAFVAADINGNVYSESEIANKIIVLNFWFIGCGPCRKEMPELNKIVDQYANNQEVIFLSIALDSKDEIQDFLKGNIFKYKIIANGGKLTSNVFGVKLWPTHIVINKKNEIAFLAEGNTVENLEALRNNIQSLVTNK